MQYRITLLLVFLLGLLLTACSNVSSQSDTPHPTATPTRLTSGIRVLLVPAAGTSTPTEANLTAARTTLTQRFAAFGFNNAEVHEVTSGSQPALQVEVPTIPNPVLDT